MKNTKFRVPVLMVLLTVFLAGCVGMFGRLLSVHEQMCNFDEHVSIEINQDISVALRKPVLLESDVYQLLDAMPTSRVASEEVIIGTYQFEQVQTGSDGLKIPTGQELEIQFLFVPSEKGPMLSGMQSSAIPPEILEYLLPIVADSADIAQQVCDTSVNPFGTSVTLEIDHNTPDSLPPRQLVIAWLGPPSKSSENATELIYEFRLKGNPDEPQVAWLDLGYDQDGRMLSAIEASFTHYHASVDVPAGTLRMKLNQPLRTSL